MKYRKDIDGLRAVAVIPVIAFHAGFFGLKGGYLGVDVFFVISGYLITSILTAELLREQFSVVAFYEKRARRLLPALFFVLFVSSVAAFLLLGPQSLKDFGQSVVSVIGFISNFYFYLTSGYFSTAAEEIPLLHTWSLAVEEQYYIFYPLLLMFLWKSQKVLWNTILSLAICSFITCLVLTTKDFSASFYLPFSRAWELLAGGVVALLQTKLNLVSSLKKEFLGGGGLILVIFSLFMIDQSYLHPGWVTLIPVLGTLLIIGFGENTFVEKLLGLPFFVFIGLISYSLYLWHQPIFAFVRIKSFDEPSKQMMIAATVLAVVLAIVSYFFVEKPFRKKSLVTRKKIFLFSGLGLSFFFVFGVVSHLSEGFYFRFGADSAFSTVTHSPYRYQCHSSSRKVVSFDSSCQLSGINQPEWAVLGDSHGVELSFSLAEVLGTSNVHQLTFSGCPPAFEFNTRVEGCGDFLNKGLQHIIDSDSIENVVLTFRHLYYLTPVKHKYESTSEELNEFKPAKLSAAVELTASQLRDVYWHSLSTAIEKLTKAGKQVYLLGPVPEPRTHIKKILNPGFVFQYSGADEKVAVQRTQFEMQVKNIESNLIKIAQKYGAYLINSKNMLCDQKRYYASLEGKSMFFDDNHLSIYGSRVVIEKLITEVINQIE
jgi:peptidoglycan/LPS O-acetylase OafA/YrhL